MTTPNQSTNNSFQPVLVPGLRSPRVMTGGIYVFARMLDKIQLEKAGTLPDGYFLGDRHTGFYDGRCTRFLQVNYKALKAFVLKTNADDEAALAWCLEHGKKPSDEKLLV